MAELVDAVDKPASENSERRKKKIKSPPLERSEDNKPGELLETPDRAISSQAPRAEKVQRLPGSERSDLITGSSLGLESQVKQRPAPEETQDDDIVHDRVKIHRSQGHPGSSPGAGTTHPPYYKLTFIGDQDQEKSLELLAGNLELFWNEFEIADRLRCENLKESDLFRLRQILSQDVFACRKKFKFAAAK